MDSEETADSTRDNAPHQVRPVAGTSETDSPRSDTLLRPSSTKVSVEPPHQEILRPRRQAFLRAQTHMKSWIDDMNMDCS